MQKLETLRQPLLWFWIAVVRKTRKQEKKINVPKIVATFVYASSQGQHTHSARPKYKAKLPKIVATCCTHFARTNSDQRIFLFPSTDWTLSLNIYPCLPVHTMTGLWSPNNAAVNIYPCLPSQSLRGHNIYPWPYSTWIQAGTDILSGWVCSHAQISLVSHSIRLDAY
jgi:hypothetical protein